MLEKRIYEYADLHGIIAGICDASPLAPPYLPDIKTPFVSRSMEERLNPALSMADAKSIIVIGVGYGKKHSFIVDREIRGYISIGAIGPDYHTIVLKHLNAITGILKRYYPEKRHICAAFVDTGPLMERELAKKAGIGWQGKNCAVISQTLGSLFNIGYILTNIKLNDTMAHPSTAPGRDNPCGQCNRCVRACPGNALSGYYTCDPYRCVSYLTQKKGDLSCDEMALMGNAIYGCDICQKVCPYNVNVHTGIIEKIDEHLPPIDHFINMPTVAFHALYGNTAIFWRGRNTLRRNAIIAAGNSGDKAALQFLAPFRNHESSSIKNAAEWAIRQLSS